MFKYFKIFLTFIILPNLISWIMEFEIKTIANKIRNQITNVFFILNKKTELLSHNFLNIIIDILLKQLKIDQ